MQRNGQFGDAEASHRLHSKLLKDFFFLDFLLSFVNKGIMRKNFPWLHFNVIADQVIFE